MNRIKYPRTPHLPFSPGRSDDDIGLGKVEFTGEVVVTEKLDGENTTLYHDYLHARSLTSASHPSRDWLKRFHAGFRHQIPAGMRICGENLFAVHSVPYQALPAWFVAFAVFEGDFCLPWDECVEWCGLIGLPTVPVLYRGPWDERAVRACWTGQSRYGGEQEGYVVRRVEGFKQADFGRCVAKYVRPGHVQTSDDWLRATPVPNGLAR